MKKIVLSVLCFAVAFSITGCVCDGTETSFRDIDQKYANSKWTAWSNWVPLLTPFLVIDKAREYQRVLLKKPESDCYECIRWENRFYLNYLPDERY